MTDARPEKPTPAEELFKFLRLIRERTLSRQEEWSEEETKTHLAGRKILDTWLLHHCMHHSSDLNTVRLVAERVRRSFYAKAFNGVSEAQFEATLPLKLWGGFSVELWIYKQVAATTAELKTATAGKRRRFEQTFHVLYLWRDNPPSIQWSTAVRKLGKALCSNRRKSGPTCHEGCDILFLHSRNLRQEEIARALKLGRATIGGWLADCEGKLIDEQHRRPNTRL